MIVFNKEIEKEVVGKGISRKIIAKGNSLMMVEVCFKKGGRGEVHSHIHEQISYIHKGSFEFELDGEKKMVTIGDSVYIPSNTLHGVLALENDSIIIDVFTPQREDFFKK